MKDTNLVKSTSNFQINIKTINDINIELVTSEIDEILELYKEIEPNDEQELQISVGASFSSWELAKAYLNNYAKAASFSLR
ncbi:24766_t:CDS:2 [Racocetra persica]|uniref:24766_t:CDS:1 n=1 Tax=Racocetra persica TaxID=160502 RepID=A0ACA9LJY7_9GLOM|nr:24766_t:CDS:2 [Racocetra persica]